MSRPEPPGIPGRHLPGRTRLPPPKDPRTDSGGAMPILIPEQPPVARFDAAPTSRKESVFSALKPDRWAINVAFVLASLGIGGSAVLSRGTASVDAEKVAALVATIETQKGEVNQLKDRVRLNESRQKDFESEAATALSHAPCVSKKVGLRTELVCGGYKLQGFPAVRATVTSETMDPPTFKVQLADGTEVTPWPKQ